MVISLYVLVVACLLICCLLGCLVVWAVVCLFKFVIAGVIWVWVWRAGLAGSFSWCL